jgi:glucose/arabinose dehydrogenase
MRLIGGAAAHRGRARPRQVQCDQVSRGIARICAGAAALVSALAAAGPVPAAVPPEFTDALVADVSVPTALAFTPDGRMLITTQAGLLRIYANGSLLSMPALDLRSRVCSNSERGLLGVAVDPAFGTGTNRRIYLYHTASVASACVNRVARFELSDANLVDPLSEAILIDQIPSPAGNHNGGDLNFGKDGNLYVAIGDGGCDWKDLSRCGGSNAAARDEYVLLGKILRITPNGEIPTDNPFSTAVADRCNTTGRTTAGRKCRETFAWGLRNPFRFAFDPHATGTRFFINDVGQNTWEEIDEGQSGADYGWNVREGPCRFATADCAAPPPGMTNPVYWYDHSAGCRAITGGAFVPNGVWPSQYDGDYLYGDFVCGKIVRLEPSGTGGYSPIDFATGLGSSSAVHMRFGPWNGPFGWTQALYYTTYASSGEVRRIGYTAGPPPVPQPPSPLLA